ncbi:unnamed protein product [Camellia sinensis]
MNVDKINRDELYEYWSQITDQSFDSRLQIFFDIKNGKAQKQHNPRNPEKETKSLCVCVL